MTLDQCLGANRPLTFVIAESDVEVLQHMSKNYPENSMFVYSTTQAGTVPLKQYLNPRRSATTEAKSTVTVIEEILSGSIGGSAKNYGFTTVIFLGCETYLHDPQIVRKISDVMTRYQVDEEFTTNMVMISQSVCVPKALERFSEVVVFDLPTEAQLKTLSDHLATKLDLKDDRAPTEEVVNNLKGLTLFEVEQAYLQSHYLFKKVDLPFVRQFKKSAISKTDLLSLMETGLTFDDIGGLDRLKAWIRKSIGGWTIEGQKFGLPLLKGVLLVGLPGSGKSLMAKALGNAWGGLPVIEFDPSRVFSSRVGDSESNMRRVLQIVENMSPCILMVDEIEKGLAGLQSSSYSDSGVTARVIRSFLVWLQDCTKPVFTIATANNISALPPELISRFDETFFVNLPQKEERKEIFRIHIAKLKRDPAKFDLEALADRSTRLSGREIEQALRESMYDCFHAKVDLNTATILDVLAKKTTITTTMAEQLQKLMDWVGFDKEKGDGLRARYASTPDLLDIDRVKGEIDGILKDIEKGPQTGGGNIGFANG